MLTYIDDSIRDYKLGGGEFMPAEDSGLSLPTTNEFIEALTAKVEEFPYTTMVEAAKRAWADTGIFQESGGEVVMATRTGIFGRRVATSHANALALLRVYIALRVTNRGVDETPEEEQPALAEAAE